MKQQKTPFCGNPIITNLRRSVVAEGIVRKIFPETLWCLYEGNL